MDRRLAFLFLSFFFGFLVHHPVSGCTSESLGHVFQNKKMGLVGQVHIVDERKLKRQKKKDRPAAECDALVFSISFLSMLFSAGRYRHKLERTIGGCQTCGGKEEEKKTIDRPLLHSSHSGRPLRVPSRDDIAHSWALVPIFEAGSV